MPWLKSDDDMPNNEKIWALSDPLYRLYEAGRFYAAKNLTDGHVPANRITQLTPTRATKAQIGALVRARLWHELPGLGCESCLSWRKKKGAGPTPRSGYLVHDYLEYNPSKAQWTKAETQRKVAGKQGAEARWGPKDDGEPHGEPHGESHSEPDAVRHSEPHGEGHSEPHGDSLSEMHGEMHAPYPVPRTPVPGAIAPVSPQDDPFPEDADLSIRGGRREGVRHVRGAANAVVAAARRRSAS